MKMPFFHSWKGLLLTAIVIGVGVWFFTSQKYKKQMAIASNVGGKPDTTPVV